MPILKIEAEFGGSRADLCKAAEELLKAFGQNTFENLTSRNPLTVQIVTNDHETLLELPVRELGISPRVRNLLSRVGIEKVGEVTEKHRYELREIPNFGKGCLQELEAALEAHGLSIRQ
jgi:DNA-directed RNA polymerase alpha subunit